MNEDHREELAAQYALDLLEGPERAEFEAELERDSSLRQKVEDLRQVAATLAHTAPPADPPAELKTRISASAAREAALPPRMNRPASLLSFPVLFPWALAACFALVAAWTGQRYVSARAEAALMRDQQSLADLELQAVRNRLEAEHIVSQHALSSARLQLSAIRLQLADSERQIASLSDKLKSAGDLAQFKIAVLASGTGNSSRALAVAVWVPVDQEGVLSVSELPALAQNKDYQLWVIDPRYPAPVSGGVFTVDPATGKTRVNFRAQRRIESVAKFAVSLERKGGVSSPEGPIVLISQ